MVGTVTFETLKKRRIGLFRTVLIPPELATMLDLVFGLRGLRGSAAKAPMWPFSRASVWRRIKKCWPPPEHCRARDQTTRMLTVAQ